MKLGELNSGCEEDKSERPGEKRASRAGFSAWAHDAAGSPNNVMRAWFLRYFLTSAPSYCPLNFSLGFHVDKATNFNGPVT